MAATVEKTEPLNEIQASSSLPANPPSDVASIKSAVSDKARLLGATPDEVLEAEEHAQTLSLEETKKVRLLVVSANVKNAPLTCLACRGHHLLP